MKSEPFYGIGLLELSTKILAMLFGLALIIAATIETVHVFYGIYMLNVANAVQDGLFVLIFLEMFFVVRSFIKYGSVNTALIISVGIVAIVKQVIFNLKTMDLNTAIAFTVLFLGFCIGYMIENRGHQFKVVTQGKPRKITGFSPLQEQESQVYESVEQ